MISDEFMMVSKKFCQLKKLLEINLKYLSYYSRKKLMISPLLIACYLNVTSELVKLNFDKLNQKESLSLALNIYEQL